ncbi:MAG: hypothetical protein ABI142_00825, partial [Bryocella sp.]
FMLGCFSLIWYQHSTSVYGLLAPVMVLALPLLDVLLAICRRSLRKVPLFGADRGHIHHRMLARGFKPGQVAWILYAACSVAAMLALLQNFAHTYVRAATVFVFLALLIGGIRYLDYIELGAARRALSQKRILGSVRDEIFLYEIERSIGGSQSEDECWEHVQEICGKLGFSNILMYLDGRYYEYSTVVIPPDMGWKITLPLTASGYIILSRAGHERAPRLTLHVLDRLQESLSQRGGQQRTVVFKAKRRALEKTA